jgi:hypothetical protein
MKKHPLTASGLRIIFLISLFILTLIGSALFWFTNERLKEFATDVNHTVVDASASQSNIQTLQKVQKELADQKDVVDRASSIVAESKSYQYQNQIINDLNDYAAKSGITITNIDFSSGAAPSAATMPKSASPTAPVAPGINGVKSTSVSITLKNPVVYNNMIRFIKSIEQNLTKMQLSKVSLSKNATGGVSSEVLTLEVYIR